MGSDHGFGRTLHVNVKNGSDTNSGSEASPFKTVGHAANTAQPGDTVLIHEGVYHEQILGGNSGTEQAPIIFQGINRTGVVFQGSVHVSDWERSGPYWVKRGLNPITPDNAFVMIDQKVLLKRASSPYGLKPGSFFLDQYGTYTIKLADHENPNTDRRVEVYELDIAFNSGARWGGTAKKHIVLRNFTLEKYGGHAIATDEGHPSDNSHWELDKLILRYNNNEAVFHCLDDWYVHDNTFIRNRGHGCQIDGARVKFHNNFSAFNEWFGPYVDGGCGVLLGPNETANSCLVQDNIFAHNGDVEGYGCAVFLEARAHSNHIHRNLMYANTPDGVGIYGSSYNVVTENIIVDSGYRTKWPNSGAILIDRGPVDAPAVAVRNLIANNTIWGCPSPIAIINPHLISFYELNIFANNFFGKCKKLLPMPEEPTILLRSNWFFECPESDSNKNYSLREFLDTLRGKSRDTDLNRMSEDSLMYGDPRFISPEKLDFGLQPDSPLIGAGESLNHLKPGSIKDRTESLRHKIDIGAIQSK